MMKIYFLTCSYKNISYSVTFVLTLIFHTQTLFLYIFLLQNFYISFGRKWNISYELIFEYLIIHELEKNSKPHELSDNLDRMFFLSANLKKP